MNSLSDYKDFIYDNLPSGMTFNSVISRFVVNGRNFLNYWEAKWYLDYLNKISLPSAVRNASWDALTVWDLKETAGADDAAKKDPAVDSPPTSVQFRQNFAGTGGLDTVTIYSGSGIVLDGWDFTGWHVLFNAASTDVTFRNCIFGHVDIERYLHVIAGTAIVEDCTFDGGKQTDYEVLAAITVNAGATATIRTSRFQGMAKDNLALRGTCIVEDCYLKRGGFELTAEGEEPPHHDAIAIYAGSGTIRRVLFDHSNDPGDTAQRVGVINNVVRFDELNTGDNTSEYDISNIIAIGRADLVTRAFEIGENNDGTDPDVTVSNAIISTSDVADELFLILGEPLPSVAPTSATNITRYPNGEVLY